MKNLVINCLPRIGAALAGGRCRPIMNEQRTGMGGWIISDASSLPNESSASLFRARKLGCADNPVCGRSGRSDRPLVRGQPEDIVGVV